MEAGNHWQPVTEIYQEIVEQVPASHFDADPMTLVKQARRARAQAEVKVPFGITAITGLYFIRAAIYGLFAAKLVTSSGSALEGWIVAHCPALIPLALSSADPKTLPTTMAEALAVMAVLSLGLGLMWLLRWKPILFISIGMSGYFLAHIAISYYNIAGLGDPYLFTPTQLDLVVVEGALNLLIFLYIALYPGLKRSFQRQF